MNDMPLLKRKNIRLPHYDYSKPGAYFVTICTHGSALFFGTIRQGAFLTNPAGSMIHRWWVELERKFSGIRLDEFIVMPNHVHGIMWIESPVGVTLRGHPSLSDVMDWFKTMTTNEYIRGVKTQGWPRFDGHVWQRGFYEHVIRTERTLAAIRRYIVENPLRWELDRENPDRVSKRAAK